MNTELNQYETPFADVSLTKEEPSGNGTTEAGFLKFIRESENPFVQTFELTQQSNSLSPFANEFAGFLGELNDQEFSDNLYELASELEEAWNSGISNETAMGEAFIPYARQKAAAYFSPLISASENMIDRISQRFSGYIPPELSVSEMEAFFNEVASDHSGLSPAQEQFFGSIFKKVTNAVKKGIEVVGKLSPVNIILGKLKGLIRPLLDRVLKFAIGKLPKNLQPYAQTLAKKFLNLESPFVSDREGPEVSSAGEIDAIQTELDNQIASLVFSSNETQVDNLVMQYESASEDTSQTPSLQAARDKFINELRELKVGENPAPAIEGFLPVAIMALHPIIKTGISLIGRQKVINFLAGLLAQLVAKYVPQQVAKPLAASIIDAGMTVIGFETYEMSKPDVGYEALVNTIQETIQNMGDLNETDLNDHEALTMNLLEAFETAAANNFPPQYIREDLRNARDAGIWVGKPRNGARSVYKKYTKVFPIVISPSTAKSVVTFRGLPLANFLRDKLGLDPSKPIQARVHLYEITEGTKLSQISKHENLPGFGPSQPYSWIQLHPLSKEASALLLNEPSLGKDFPNKYTAKRYHVALGQRFYYLEINGAHLRMGSVTSNNKPAHSDDIRGVLNFVKSSISINYYFSEEQAKSVVEKLNQNDFLGAASGIRHSVKGVMESMLLGNVSGKVQIIHEAFPEMYLENYSDPQENLLGSGKSILTGVVENLVNKLAGKAYDEIRDYFKSRAAEFKQAQAEPQDGVTLKLIWSNVPGLAAIKSIISAIRGNLSFNPAMLTFPSLSKPEIVIKAGKHFD
jgi:hypothetical protein